MYRGHTKTIMKGKENWMKEALWFNKSRTPEQEKNKYLPKVMKENITELQRIKEIGSILSVFNNMMDEKEKEEAENLKSTQNK